MRNEEWEMGDYESESEPLAHAKPPVIDQVSRLRRQTGWRVLLNVQRGPIDAMITDRR